MSIENNQNPNKNRSTICPTCGNDFWALFISADGVARCRKDRDAYNAMRPITTEPPKAEGQPGRPYVTRRTGPATAELTEARRAKNLCIKCGSPAQEYSPGNFSYQCEAHNRADAEKRNARRVKK